MKRATFFLVLLACALAPAAAEDQKKPPYWASISAGKAMMRAGPGRNYPGTWLYVRADLPVRVVETYPDWRKIKDPKGETGWMLQRLLSSTRTALVTGTELRPLYEKADVASPIRYRAQPGVVGRISRCGEGWCRLDVGGRQGYIRTDHIWGIDPGERVD
jgi:SH3-like domain-containing protein